MGNSTVSAYQTSVPDVTDGLFCSDASFLCRFRHLASKASCRCCGDRSGLDTKYLSNITVTEIFSVAYWCDLEIWVRGR